MDFKSLLWRELKNNGLIVNQTEFKEGWSVISKWGIKERQNIIKIVGLKTWKKVLKCLHSNAPEDDSVRILGFGRAQTEFIISPLCLPDDMKRKISTLGSLSSFLMLIYDNLVDNGYNNNLILPGWALHSIAKEQGGLRLKALQRLGTSPSRLMVTLVDHYFRSLKELPYYRKHIEVAELIKLSIFQMHDAENKTLHENHLLLSESTLKKKSVYPYVIKGLPGWLCIQKISSKRYDWHVKWMHQFGEFFAWIDDAVDMGVDATKGHPNLYLSMQASGEGKEQNDIDLARNIAQIGRQMISEWQQNTKEYNEIPIAIRNAPNICAVSWFGGLSIFD